MNSPLYKIGSNDVWKGAVTAILAAVVTVLYGFVTQADFSIFSADWGAILNEAVKVSFAAFLAYIMKNFGSDYNGDFLGVRPTE